MKTKKITQLDLVLAVCVSFMVTTLFSCSSEVKKTESQPMEWRRVGIGGGGAQFNPAISPHDPNTVFVACDMSCSFVTYDGGDTWRMFNLGSVARFFVIDPVDPNVVYAQSLGLFKSEDKGHTWKLLYPKPSETLGKVSKGDHAGEILITSDSTRRSVLTLAIDPTQSKNLYAAIRIDQAIALYSSTDGGESWVKEKDYDHDIKAIFIDPTSPADQRSLYVAWNKGVDQRVNGSWQSYSTPGENVEFNFFSGGYDVNAKKYILYTISGRGYFNQSKEVQSGIYYSDNGGKTWENRQDGLLQYGAPGLQRAEFRALATSAFNPATLYVSYNGLKTHPDTTCIGVAKSEDFGKTWTLSWVDKFFGNDWSVSSNFSYCWMNERFGPEWGENPFSLAVSPHDAALCYGTDFGRSIKTKNGGKTWEGVYSTKLPDNTWTTRGIDVTTCYNIVFDPFDENHIFIALTDIGLMESKNGGKGWLSATHNNGIPRPWINTTYWLISDPEVKGRYWAVMSGIHDLPLPKMFRGGISHYTGGVVHSDDAGKTWKSVSSSIGEGAATHILMDPTSNKDSRTLYVSVYGKGVYKSTDGGKTWQQKNNGIEGDEPFAWQIDRRETDGTLFLVVCRRSWTGTIGDDWDGAMYKSTDGAETWTKMTLPDNCNGPMNILTTKKYPKRLILSAWGRITPGRLTPDVGGGIFISDDEGKSWTQVMGQNNYDLLPPKSQAMISDQHIWEVTYDPRTDRFYACGFNASAYYSEDGAKTWTRIRGYNFKQGKRVTPDPHDPEMVYIITFGGGVWHGPAKGVPDATEDVVTYFERR